MSPRKFSGVTTSTAMTGSLRTGLAFWQHALKPIELHGTAGSLRVPDPNFYGGLVQCTEGRGDWISIDTSRQVCGGVNFPDEAPQHANYRMLGVAEFAEAIRDGRRPRASGQLGLHVLEVLYAVL